MKLCTHIFLIILALGIGLLYSQYRSMSAPLPMPDLDFDAYWGPGLRADHKATKDIRSVEIRYLTDAGKPIEKLQRKLNQSLVLHPPLEGVGFEYGVNTASFLDFVKYWRDDYLPRWEEREKFLNQFPHFTTEIQGYVSE